MGFKAQELSNSAYALGHLGVEHCGFWEAFCEHTPLRLGEFNDQNFANTVCALGLLDPAEKAPGRSRLLAAICRDASRRLGEFTAQGISSLVHGLASLGFSNDRLFLHAVCHEAAGRLDEFGEHELSNLVFALGLLGYRDANFLRALCTHLPG